MTRLADIKAYIEQDSALLSLVTSGEIEDLYEVETIINTTMVPTMSGLSPSWLSTFLAREALWIKFNKIANDAEIPDDNVIKNICAIITAYLMSGRTEPIDFTDPPVVMMLGALWQSGTITQDQHDQVLAKVTVMAPYPVVNWADGTLTSVEEIRAAMELE